MLISSLEPSYEAKSNFHHNSPYYFEYLRYSSYLIDFFCILTAANFRNIPQSLTSNSIFLTV